MTHSRQEIGRFLFELRNDKNAAALRRLRLMPEERGKSEAIAPCPACGATYRVKLTELDLGRLPYSIRFAITED